MALQMNYQHPELDVTIYNAYWRINPNTGIIGGKNGIKFTIEVYKSAEVAHTLNSKTIKGFTFTFVPNLSDTAPNFIKQAYNHVKTLPMFNGSVDV
jgi:hypothetical protein